MPASKKWSSALALVLATSLALPVAAQKNTADPTYKKALALEVAGNFAAALSLFESILPAKRLPATRMHIASCKAHLGRFLSAEADLVELVADPKIGEAERETAKGDLDLVRDKMPKLTIVLLPSAEGAKVTLDGQEVTLPATRGLDAGSHQIVATKGLKEVYRRDVTLQEGAKVTIEVDDPNAAPKPAVALEPTKTVTAKPVMDTHAATADVKPSSGRKTAALVIGAVGVVGLGVGTFFWLHANSQNATANDQRNAGEDWHATEDSSKSSLNIARIGLGVGLVGVGVGTFLLLTSPKASTTTSTGALRFTPTVGTNSAGFAMGGAW